MALVFISHAHGDEDLARRVVTLLRDALSLQPKDFFVSSLGGRGVAPAASIRDEILKELTRAPSLIVLVTPKSVASPWVWFEAGNRLGNKERSNPIFAVPSQRFLPLAQPVADLRCLRLDNEGDMHELIKAVGEGLGRPSQGVLNYSVALRDLVSSAQSVYGPLGEWKARAVAWLKTHAAALILAGIAIAGLVIYGNSLVTRANRAADEARQRAVALEGELKKAVTGANEAMNEELSRTAARYLILKGVVMAGQTPIPRARVVASLESDVPANCGEPACTFQNTTSAGEFRLNLTKIYAQNGDDIVLTVTAPGFEVFTKQVRVDVRAMDVGVPGHTVTLKPGR